jgi:hypothetical protein
MLSWVCSLVILNLFSLSLSSYGWGLLIFSCFGILLDIDTGLWLALLVAV